MNALLGWRKRLSMGRAWGSILAILFAITLGVPVPSVAESPVDLNRASLEELTSLPGIGPARARAIIERREEAPFEATDDLTEVSGIGSALVDKLRGQVQVGDSGQAKSER